MQNRSDTFTVQNLRVTENSTHRGLSYFYNPVKIESSLSVDKDIRTNKISLGDITFRSEDTDRTLRISLPHSDSYLEFKKSHLSIGGALPQIGLGGYILECNNKNSFSILQKDASNSLLSINRKGQIGINTTSQTAQLDISGNLKSTSFSTHSLISPNGTIGNLIVDNLSIRNDLVLTKEKMVVFQQSNIAPPSLGTRSIGSKVVLFPAISDKTADYAIGVQQGGMWFSLPMDRSNFSWKFYAKDDPVFSINGLGDIEVKGSLNLIDSGRIEKDTYTLHWFRIRDLVQVEVSIHSDLPVKVELPVRGLSYKFLDGASGEGTVTNHVVLLDRGITRFSYIYFKQ